MKEIRKTRANINEIEKKKTIEKNSENKSWFCGKISKINKPLARLSKKKKKKGVNLSIKLEIKRIKIKKDPKGLL